MLRGLDVSSAQGVVNWPSLAKIGLRFAFIKCSEGNRGNDPIFDTPGYLVDHRRAAGTSGQDTQFQINVDGATSAGIAAGPYHFAYPLPPQVGNPIRDPRAQAKFAFDLAAGLGSIAGDLPPALDLEWPPPQDWPKWGCTAPQIRDWGLQWLDEATGLWGCKPIIYTYPDFWMHLGGGSEPAFAQYGLWSASYPPGAARWPKDGEKPTILKPWADWTFWQWTGGGADLPNGVHADYDVFSGGEVELTALLKPPPERDMLPDLG
jgi:lysozyme